MLGNKEKIVVLGASGMLGQAVAQILSSQPNIRVVGSVNSCDLQNLKVQSIEYFKIDASIMSADELRLHLNGASHVINCLGLIWQRVNNSALSLGDFKIVNTEFAGKVGKVCDDLGIKLIQVSTDCVFSGSRGNYSEDSLKDATDPYGRSKSFAEELLPNATIFRTSIIGLSPLKGHSLLDWFTSIQDGESIKGFINHQWNGITNLVYARLLLGFIQQMSLQTKPGIYHIIPRGIVSKHQLLLHFKKYFHKESISVVPVEHENAIDRTLTTIHDEFHHRLWKCAGYNEPMNIEEMIAQLAQELKEERHV